MLFWYHITNKSYNCRLEWVLVDNQGKVLGEADGDNPIKVESSEERVFQLKVIMVLLANLPQMLNMTA